MLTKSVSDTPFNFVLACRSGSNAWRDTETPFEVLTGVAKLRNLKAPVWHAQPPAIAVAGNSCPLTEFGEIYLLFGAFTLSSLAVNLIPLEPPAPF